MRERLVYLAYQETIPDSGLWVKNIDVVDAITQIDLIFEATTGSTSCTDHEIHDDVSKIEVVSGGDVLFSLPMQEAMALNCFEKGKFPLFDFDEGASKTVKEGVSICFGRHARDQELYLDPKAFRNLQLRVSYGLTLSTTAGFTSGSGKVTAIAHVIEGPKGPHRGFLTAKLVKTYTGAASSHEYTDMPVDYPYRLLLLKALRSTYEWQEQIDTVKLHADREKFVKFEMSGADLAMLNEKIFPTLVQRKTLLEADDGSALLDLYKVLQASVFTTEDDHIAVLEGVDAEKLSVGLYDLTTPGTPAFQSTAKAVVAAIEGYQPFSCVAMPMGDLDDPDDWWEVGEYGAVTLDILTTSAGTGAMSIVLQQLRS